MKYRLIPLLESSYKDSDWIKPIFNKVKKFYKDKLKVDLSHMKLQFTNKRYNEDGTIKTNVPNNRPEKGPGDWTEKGIIYIRPNQMNVETQHMDDMHRNRYAAQVIAHELAHECLHNDLLDIRKKGIPLTKTKYALSFKQGSDEYKEELYADSLGNYIARQMYKGYSENFDLDYLSKFY